MTLGIIAALRPEISTLLDEMEHKQPLKTIAMRDYYCGSLWGQEVVITLSRIGKVAAASTTTTLINQFDVRRILFTGVAGGCGSEVNIGDIVIANRLVQHDMDCRPLFPRYEIPLLDMSYFTPDSVMQAELDQATRQYLKTFKSDFLSQAPQIHHGQIASGDVFMNDRAAVQALTSALPNTLAVEMEGAAIAQICHEYQIPYGVIRTISDRADAHSHIDFDRFLHQVAAQYSHGIIREFLQLTKSF